MTPLAHRIVKRLTLPLKKREYIHGYDIAPLLADAHCFDVTDVLEMLNDLRDKLMAEHLSGEGFDGTLAFLPAPKTWIEYRDPEKREGFLLQAPDVRSGIATMHSSFGNRELLTGTPGGKLALLSNDPPCLITPAPAHDKTGRLHIKAQYFLYAALAAINSPKILGRRQSMPHRGLERDLLRAGVGKFPLHAWTEIQLSVHPPKEDDGEHEAHLTGKKALHFCRAHLRIKMGKLEYVRAHWRGDPALGMKRSRYKVGG
jgi:hypothetical protein